MCRRCGTPTWLARVLFHRAELYSELGDTPAAEKDALEALEVAEASGLLYMADRSRVLLDSL